MPPQDPNASHDTNPGATPNPAAAPQSGAPSVVPPSHTVTPAQPTATPVTAAPTPSPAPVYSSTPMAPAQPTVGSSSPEASAPQEDPGHTLGIIGLILAFFMPFAGLIVSVIARSKSKKAGFKNGVAKAGIIVNAVFLILGVVITAVMLLGLFKVANVAGGDIQAQHDINVIHGELEKKRQLSGFYPSDLSQIPGLPLTNEVAPDKYTYTYSASPAGCTTTCTSYTLETKLSNGEVYKKEALNGRDFNTGTPPAATPNSTLSN